MSFIGTGGEDWVSLDLDLFDGMRLARVKELLAGVRDQLDARYGAGHEVEVDSVGSVFVTVDGVRHARAEVSADDRLVLTGILDPEGPL